MAKGIYVGVDGKARKVKKIYVGIEVIAHRVKKADVGVGGVAKLFFSGGYFKLKKSPTVDGEFALLSLKYTFCSFSNISLSTLINLTLFGVLKSFGA